jgi:hypothetical protein
MTTTIAKTRTMFDNEPANSATVKRWEKKHLTPNLINFHSRLHETGIEHEIIKCDCPDCKSCKPYLQVFNPPPDCVIDACALFGGVQTDQKGTHAMRIELTPEALKAIERDHKKNGRAVMRSDDYTPMVKV